MLSGLFFLHFLLLKDLFMYLKKGLFYVFCCPLVDRQFDESITNRFNNKLNPMLWVLNYIDHDLYTKRARIANCGYD